MRRSARHAGRRKGTEQQMKRIRLLPIFAFALLPLPFQGAPPAGGPSLDGERIVLTLKKNGDVSVRIDYYFVGSFRGVRTLYFPEKDYLPLKNFQALWNGRKVPVKKKLPPAGRHFVLRGALYQALHEQRLPSTSALKNVLVNRYDITPPHFERGDKSGNPAGRLVEYVLRTGATWSGPIKSAEVFFHTGAYPCERIRHLEDSYEGECRRPNLWHLKLEYFEPDRDIRLLLPD